MPPWPPPGRRAPDHQHRLADHFRWTNAQEVVGGAGLRPHRAEAGPAPEASTLLGHRAAQRRAQSWSTEDAAAAMSKGQPWHAARRIALLTGSCRGAQRARVLAVGGRRPHATTPPDCGPAPGSRRHRPALAQEPHRRRPQPANLPGGQLSWRPPSPRQRHLTLMGSLRDHHRSYLGAAQEGRPRPAGESRRRRAGGTPTARRVPRVSATSPFPLHLRDCAPCTPRRSHAQWTS